MRQCIVTAHISILTKVPKGLQHTHSYENINIGIISKDIYTKNLIITPMYFHETNGQVGQIKCKSKCQCVTNSMKPSHTINTRVSNEYSLKVLLVA